MLWKKLAVPAAVLLAALLTGCATPTKMAMSENPAAKPSQDNAVYLMTATIKNAYKPSFQPDLLVTHFEKNGGATSADRINFVMDELAKDKNDAAKDGHSYLLRFELDKGKYNLRGMTAMANAFIVIGNFFIPLHQELNANEPGLYYLGHVQADVRERQGNEFRAGPPIPLIDQAATGASGGTFDVAIQDAWETDEAKFRKRFPGLADQIIHKAILPPFDRAAAQKWWEDH
ncbi:hypothetical protein [Chromobacterium subtsugae]|uniref:hypothetical protein n=1 Tax=Chromobacterium subtsugae TaxID=251747 RepID=UPI000640BFE2|nr:hypothetical protein [Chromobacterium subtsugae]